MKITLFIVGFFFILTPFTAFAYYTNSTLPSCPIGYDCTPIPYEPFDISLAETAPVMSTTTSLFQLPECSDILHYNMTHYTDFPTYPYCTDKG